MEQFGTNTIRTWTELCKIETINKNIWITGSPASGKSTLGKALFDRGFANHLTHTDAFINGDFASSMYSCLDTVRNLMAQNLYGIVEGVYIPRMLRKCVDLGYQLPDIVIVLEISEQRFIDTYMRERDVTKLKGAMALFKGSSKIMEDLSELLPSSVEILKFQNNY